MLRWMVLLPVYVWRFKSVRRRVERLEREELRARCGVRDADMVYSDFWMKDRDDFDEGLIHEQYQKVRHDNITKVKLVMYRKLRLFRFNYVTQKKNITHNITQKT